MSFVETSLQTGYPDEFSDTVAKMTASILQEQLAPIVETLHEHARLLDLHAALLNHSTAMDRYNVGKIDDIRDFQNNINFKLQFYVHPEDRWYPNYQTPSASTSTSTETLSNAESRLPAADAHTQADEPTHSTAASPGSSSSSVAAASPGLPDRPSTPAAATEPADSRPTTPSARQQLGGDGFSVDPAGPSRRLQRERPFSVAPDPMWNSSREIRPYEHLATRHAPPPPPYVLPPTYYAAEVVPPQPGAGAGAGGQIESVEEVVLSEEPFFPVVVETIEIVEPASTLQSPILDVRDVSSVSFSSTAIVPRVPVTGEEAREADEVDYDDENSCIGPQVATSADDAAAHDDHPSRSRDPSTFLRAGAVDSETENSTTTSSENETGDDLIGSGDENPAAESQLSEKARGKKRMREEDYYYSLDEKDDLERLENLLGEPEGGCSGSSSSDRDRDGEPDRKRMKKDADTDTRINTDRLEVDEPVLMVARMGLVEPLTDAESWRQVKKLKDIKKLYRSGSLIA